MTFPKDRAPATIAAIMTASHAPLLTRPRVAALALATLCACTSWSQNIKGQELSYRGAWACAQPGCDAKGMTRSTRGTTRGTLKIQEVKLDPKAAVVFTSAAPFSTLKAELVDCKGKANAVPEDRILKPGSHGVGTKAEQESWVVMVDRELGAGLALGGDCDTWLVRATAGWDDGRTFTLDVGLTIR